MKTKQLSPEELWKAFLKSQEQRPSQKRKDASENQAENPARESGEATENASYEAWHFCDNQADADELARLVLEGRKRATAGALWSYEAEGEPLPQPGDYSVITDWEGQGICIIQTTGVSVVPFNQVSPDFAAREGEGDGSLEYWRKVHREAFTRELEEINRTTGSSYSFTDDMPVVCEEFRLIYSPSRSNIYVLQTAPFIVPTEDGKHIEEHFGSASTDQEDLSIARMIAPPGWSEPSQRPEFDEYTFIIRGKKRVNVEGETIDLEAGQSIRVAKGSRVQYSNPFTEEVEYLAVCLPAFKPDLAHRGEEE